MYADENAQQETPVKHIFNSKKVQTRSNQLSNLYIHKDLSIECNNLVLRIPFNFYVVVNNELTEKMGRK